MAQKRIEKDCRSDILDQVRRAKSPEIWIYIGAQIIHVCCQSVQKDLWVWMKVGENM